VKGLLVPGERKQAVGGDSGNTDQTSSSVCVNRNKAADETRAKGNFAPGFCLPAGRCCTSLRCTCGMAVPLLKRYRDKNPEIPTRSYPDSSFQGDQRPSGHHLIPRWKFGQIPRWRRARDGKQVPRLRASVRQGRVHTPHRSTDGSSTSSGVVFHRQANRPNVTSSTHRAK
jgi:hypothetical protein